MDAPGKRTAMFLLLLPSSVSAVVTNSSWHPWGVGHELKGSQVRWVVMLEEGRDRAHQRKLQGARLAFKELLCDKEIPSQRWLSLQELGKLRCHITGLTGPSLGKQHCQKWHLRSSWIKRWNPSQDKGSWSNISPGSRCLSRVGQSVWKALSKLLSEEETVKSCNEVSVVENSLLLPYFPNHSFSFFPLTREQMVPLLLRTP